MEVAVGLEPTKTGFAGQRLDHFGIATCAQEPDGKITWAQRSKRLTPYGDDLCEGLRR